MRVLRPPTLVQWEYPNRWKTTTTWPVHDGVVPMGYLTCRWCGIKVKTEERLVVPWYETNLVEQVKTRLPKGQAVTLRDRGISELPLARLNARLAPYGYVIHADKDRESMQIVRCTGEDGQVERFGLFEFRRTSPASPHDMLNQEMSQKKKGIME